MPELFRAIGLGLRLQGSHPDGLRPEASGWQSCKYVLKDVPESYYLNFIGDIWPRLRHSQNSHIRLPCDTIPDHRVLVYKHLSHDLLKLVREGLAPHSKRRILKSVLQGLAGMHEQGIVHIDVKPDNILVDCHDDTDGTKRVDKVQITDFDNAVWLKPGKNVLGMLAGNDNWRSPEAHMRAKLNKPTDMFSFGVMCTYAMLGSVIFGRDQDFDHHVSQGIEPGLIRMQRQVCYFGDEAGYTGLRRHVDHDAMLCQLVDAMWEDRTAPYIPYKHFSTWPEVEGGDFKDVVLRLMSLDPDKRLTAKEALMHPWFAGTDAV